MRTLNCPSEAIKASLIALSGWARLLDRGPPPCRSLLFWRLICQPVAFFDSTETAQLTSRLAADCSVISRLFATSINVALRNSLQVVGGAIYLWRLSPAMTGSAAGVAAALVAVAITYGSFTRRTQRVGGAGAANRQAGRYNFRAALQAWERLLGCLVKDVGKSEILPCPACPPLSGCKAAARNRRMLCFEWACLDGGPPPFPVHIRAHTRPPPHPRPLC